MDFSSLDEEKLKEVAKRYGIKIKKSKHPGFYIDGKRVSWDELFGGLFPQAERLMDDKERDKDEKL